MFIRFDTIPACDGQTDRQICCSYDSAAYSCVL